jgi:hypothetical protein
VALQLAALHAAEYSRGEETEQVNTTYCTDTQPLKLAINLLAPVQH